MDRFYQQREARALVSWQTRILSQYIAGGYWTKKGEENKMLTRAQTLGFDAIDRVLAGGEASGGGVRENKPGSFERLMGWAKAGMTKRQ